MYQAMAFPLILVSAALVTGSTPSTVTVSEERFGTWAGKVETRIDWGEDGEPYFDQAACTLTNGPVTIQLTRERTGRAQRILEIWFDETALENSDANIQDAKITGLTIGDRAFQLEVEDWSVLPWFSNWDYTTKTIIAGTGAGYLLFREGSEGPFLPGELLLGPMLENRQFSIHYRAERQTDEGETAYGRVNVSTSRLPEAVGWCTEALVNGDLIRKLPDALSNRRD